jgi:photosystem II stability/assembly factor-like uncharacterized protein
MFTKNVRSLGCLAVALLIFFVCVTSGYAQEINPDLYKQLKYRFIGPQGNRFIAVVGVPGDPDICYAGAASGGIFKSTDGGIHWEPIFDDQTAASIGSLAIAPSDANIIWAGTGEISIRSNISQGNGIYKSTDAGKTWKLMGLTKTGRIGRIVIHPHNPDIVLAAAMGHCYGPQQERGVFRTTDGGKTWERVLFADEDTGCSDIIMDPNNPRILFAGMWPKRIWPWLERKSGGPGGGIHMSRDGGTTWKHLTTGLPEPPIGKIALAMSKSNSNRVYALIEHKDGVLWRSDDGGESWKLINRHHELTHRPSYYTRCAVTPDDYNEIYFVATTFSVSYDGGETFKIVPRNQSPGGDNHDMWIDPLLPDRMMVGNDNPCVSISLNGGRTWDRIRLPTAQMYHVHVDNKVPYFVYGNRQDGPSTRGPSNSLTGRYIPSGLWRSVGGCECGFAIPDPVNNNIVWSGCYEGILDRFDLSTGHSRSVSVWPDSCIGTEAAPLKYRFQWTYPIVISPHDHNKVYVGSQYVHKTTDGGHSWKIISPDLSTNNKKYQQPFGGITRDDESTYCCCIFALAESPLEEGLIWAGTNDGQVQVTRDGGEHWSNVTKNIPDFPLMGTVSNIEPSRYDAGTCYISVDFHNANIRDPYAYKTTDYGNTWKLITKDIPKGELSYVHCIREDPKRKGLLYLGTENAVYISLDDGEHWMALQNNLPHAPVHWLVVQEHFNDLVIGTYGRGFWIMDDITPFQELTSEILKSDAHLFSIRPAYRFNMVSSPMGEEDDLNRGENPPYGASINYYLKSVPQGDVKISILDENEQNVRALDGTKKAGINRVWWDLRYETLEVAKLRTSPIGEPWVKAGAKGYRTLVGVGGPPRVLVAPGVYTIKLTVNGKEFTQKLTVEKDPNSAGSKEDIQKQVNMLLEIREDFNNLVKMINQVEWVRKQLYDLTEILKEDKRGEEIIKTCKELDKKFIDLEENFFQMRLTGSDNDILRWPCKLHYKLSFLAQRVAQADFPSTIQQIEVHKMFKEQLRNHQNCLNELIDKDLGDFNTMLKEKNIPNIIIQTP